MVGGDGSFELEDISDRRRFLKVQSVCDKEKRKRKAAIFICL